LQQKHQSWSEKMEISNITDNSAVAGTDGGRGIANVNYILYILGFFLGLTAVVAVAIAYINRNTAVEPYRSHLNWQIHIFWRGITFLIATGCLYFVAMLLGFATAGLGFVLLLLPTGLGIWWLAWTIMAIVRGIQALGRGEIILR